MAATPILSKELAHVQKGKTIMSRWTFHSEMVRDLAKPGGEVLKTLTPNKIDIWHAATGIATEALELLGAVKAHVIYNKPLDIENVTEELGDIEFYLEQLRQATSILYGDAIAHNMRKLGNRYPKGYTDTAAQERADKQ